MGYYFLSNQHCGYIWNCFFIFKCKTHNKLWRKYRFLTWVVRWKIGKACQRSHPVSFGFGLLNFSASTFTFALLTTSIKRKWVKWLQNRSITSASAQITWKLPPPHILHKRIDRKKKTMKHGGMGQMHKQSHFIENVLYLVPFQKWNEWRRSTALAGLLN